MHMWLKWRCRSSVYVNELHSKSKQPSFNRSFFNQVYFIRTGYIYFRLQYTKGSTISHIFLYFKFNHLAHIAPRWYGNQISTDNQQKLFLPKHVTGGRFLLVTFFEEQKKEVGTQRYIACSKMVDTALKSFVR